MKLITQGREIRAALEALMEKYTEYYWAVAWAGKPASVFKRLVSNQNRIKRLVIGTHFDQTDPEFIATFREHSGFRCVRNQSGVFHPKVYFFQKHEKSWEALVGSANFTPGALDSNDEVVVRISSDDTKNAPEIRKTLLAVIDGYFMKGQVMRLEELDEYRERHQKARQREDYGPSSGPKEEDGVGQNSHLFNSGEAPFAGTEEGSLAGCEEEAPVQEAGSRLFAPPEGDTKDTLPHIRDLDAKGLWSVVCKGCEKYLGKKIDTLSDNVGNLIISVEPGKIWRLSDNSKKREPTDVHKDSVDKIWRELKEHGHTRGIKVHKSFAVAIVHKFVRGVEAVQKPHLHLVLKD